jgi:hypothetical protein
MIISITSSRPTQQQLPQVEKFRSTFLPKMRTFPGVVAVYHFIRPGKGDESTITIWESEDALKRYRDSDLAKEEAAFEKKINLPGAREVYPLLYSIS